MFHQALFVETEQTCQKKKVQHFFFALILFYLNMKESNCE